MDNGNLSASDVALLSGNGGNGYGWGDASFMWIFALLLLAGNGFGGWGGGNSFANAIGYENLATSNEVQRGFDNQNSMSNQRDILAAVTNGTAQSVAATNQTFNDTISVLSDKYNEITRDIGALQVGQANTLAHQNECCCNILRATDGINYNNALNTASINANTTAQVQKVLDAISANKVEELQAKVSQLELAQAVNGVVRYPMSMTYGAGASPFCGGCGCSGYTNI